jgi:hypothetical protein
LVEIIQKPLNYFVSGLNRNGKSSSTTPTTSFLFLIVQSYSNLPGATTKYAPINLISAEAYFESGDKQDLKIMESIKAPGDSISILPRSFSEAQDL